MGRYPTYMILQFLPFIHLTTSWCLGMKHCRMKSFLLIKVAHRWLRKHGSGNNIYAQARRGRICEEAVDSYKQINGPNSIERDSTKPASYVSEQCVQGLFRSRILRKYKYRNFYVVYTLGFYNSVDIILEKYLNH